MSQKLSFKVNQSGLLRLLRRDIYGRNDVYLRELIQNASDSNPSSIRVHLLIQPESRGNTARVLGVSCQDNGSGMTKKGISEEFLNLCHSSEESSPRFGRFGIGLFTYIAFASSIYVITKTPKGKAWKFRIESPDEPQSLADIHISKATEVGGCVSGTTVVLELRHPTSAPTIVHSLEYWIRSALPVELTLYETDSTANLSTVADNLMRDSDGPDTVLEKKLRQWGAQVSRHRRGAIVSVELEISPGSRDAVALCEGGVLIEEPCKDIVPPALKDLGFRGAVNVQRGYLSLDAGRSQVRRDERFSEVISGCISDFESALLSHFEKKGVFASSRWDADQLGLQRLIRSLSSTDALRVVRRLERRLRFEVVGKRSMSLLEIAKLSVRQRRVFHVSGMTWGRRESIGSIGPYKATLFVGHSHLAESIASSGGTVFHLPKNEEWNELVPRSVLVQYFGRRGIRLDDATDATYVDASVLPQKWHNALSLPKKLCRASLPTDIAVLLSHDRALIDIRRGTAAKINSLLDDRRALTTSERAVLESYLHLMAGDLNVGLRTLEEQIGEQHTNVSNDGWHHLLTRLERQFSQVIAAHQEHNWNERAIVPLLLHELRNTTISTPHPDIYPMQVRVEPSVLSGKDETEFGDIGVVVRLRYHDGLILEGGGFLEAKIIYKDDRKFTAMKASQLQMILTNCPPARVLLLDYQQIQSSLVLQEPRLSHTLSVPMSTALHLNTRKPKHNDESLYRFGIPLSHQFLLRYFRGEDLDFSKHAVEVARGDLPELVAPRYVICAAVGLGGAEAPEVPSLGEAYHGLMKDHDR